MKSYKPSHLQKKIKTRKKVIKRQRFIRSRVFFDIILAVIFVLLLVYFVFFSQTFKITNVQIDSTQEIPIQSIKKIVDSEMQKTILFFVKNDSFFLANTSVIKNRILLDYPKAGQARVKKGLFNTLYIKVQERIPETAWFFGSSTSSSPFLADQGGIIFSQISQAELTPDLTVIYSEMPQKDILAKVASLVLLERIKETKKMLEEKFGLFNVIFTEKSNGFLYARTGEGWEVYFNPSNDLALDLTKLRLLLEKEITPAKRKTLEYIDLRFSKAYYK